MIDRYLRHQGKMRHRTKNYPPRMVANGDMQGNFASSEAILVSLASIPWLHELSERRLWDTLSAAPPTNPRQEAVLMIEKALRNTPSLHGFVAQHPEILARLKPLRKHATSAIRLLVSLPPRYGCQNWRLAVLKAMMKADQELETRCCAWRTLPKLCVSFPDMERHIEDMTR
jgi:hypothetical protein